MGTMIQRTRREPSLLKLSKELGNVSRARKIMVHHLHTFYEVKRAFQAGGFAMLLESRRGPQRPHPNRISAEIKQMIFDFCLECPINGLKWVANELQLQGIHVSFSDVRGESAVHKLDTRVKRLLHL